MDAEVFMDKMTEAIESLHGGDMLIMVLAGDRPDADDEEEDED